MISPPPPSSSRFLLQLYSMGHSPPSSCLWFCSSPQFPRTARQGEEQQNDPRTKRISLSPPLIMCVLHSVFLVCLPYLSSLLLLVLNLITFPGLCIEFVKSEMTSKVEDNDGRCLFPEQDACNWRWWLMSDSRLLEMSYTYSCTNF